MRSDYRNHPLFHAARERTAAWLRPGQNAASDLLQIDVSPDGCHAAAAAVVCAGLEGAPATRIARIDLESGGIDILSHGPRSDSAPKWSPDGLTIAFLSDRERAHVKRLRLLDVATGADRDTAPVDGFVEYAQWSPDGRSILLGVAGLGVDLAGAQGGMAVTEAPTDCPRWLPQVDTGAASSAARSAWLYDVANDRARCVSPRDVNIWEAAWCGGDRIVAICSDASGEDAWYTADIRIFSLDGAAVRLYAPQDQLGCICASPSGERVAVIESICSDRTLVAGDLRIVDVETRSVAKADTLAADAVHVTWQGESHVLFAAARGPVSLVGVHDIASGVAHELWSSGDETVAGFPMPEVRPSGQLSGDCLFMRESYFSPPVLTAVANGSARDVVRLGAEGVSQRVAALGSARDFTWTAPDGRTIHGWLLTPHDRGPCPVVLEVHGGPVWFYKPRYVGRSALHQLLLSAGCAIFQPNPRGSSGRGQAFARLVFGDPGGADTHDYLSGLDALVAQDIADPARLGVVGGSYGGFMAAWLITQDQRFAAAVPVSPVANWVSEHLTCHMPYFCELFLRDSIDEPAGRYFSRSPIHFAARVRTPTLSICGALDKNTPPSQALELHNALLRNGVSSTLVTYPEEGHAGVRKMPAAFDFVARIADFLMTHMRPPKRRLVTP
jgi:dipeptidyl aminopeptidase/acylaminoacyl peptidase